MNTLIWKEAVCLEARNPSVRKAPRAERDRSSKISEFNIHCCIKKHLWIHVVFFPVSQNQYSLEPAVLNFLPMCLPRVKELLVVLVGRHSNCKRERQDSGDLETV